MTHNEIYLNMFIRLNDVFTTLFAKAGLVPQI